MVELLEGNQWDLLGKNNITLTPEKGWRAITQPTDTDAGRVYQRLTEEAIGIFFSPEWKFQALVSATPTSPEFRNVALVAINPARKHLSKEVPEWDFLTPELFKGTKRLPSAVLSTRQHDRVNVAGLYLSEQSRGSINDMLKGTGLVIYLSTAMYHELLGPPAFFGSERPSCIQTGVAVIELYFIC